MMPDVWQRFAVPRIADANRRLSVQPLRQGYGKRFAEMDHHQYWQGKVRRQSTHNFEHRGRPAG